MAGRRLVDLAVIFSASRSIARKHLELRSHQLDVFNKSSSLAKAVKTQTDRVTLTAYAAYSLSRRLNEEPSYTTSAAEPRKDNAGPSIPREKSTIGQGQDQGENLQEGLGQDHFYDRSEKNATADPTPEGELGVKQEQAQRQPLPDGTIPPSASRLGNESRGDAFSATPQTEPESSKESTIPGPSGHTPASRPDQARKFQRQSEFQIPSNVAEPSPAISSDANAANLTRGHDEDTFYTRSTRTSPVLSSLPRSKIPKQTEDTQSGDEHVEDGEINSDVFYSSEGHQPGTAIPSKEAVPEQEQVPEGINTEVFMNPRIAKMLGGKGRPQSPDLKMRAAKKGPIEHTSLAQGKDQDTFNVRTTAEQGPTHANSVSSESPNAAKENDQGKEDIESLAADLAKEVQSEKPPNIPADINAASLKTPFQMKESSVPSSRFGRIWHYGGLATGMALGAVTESVRRVTGGEGSGGSLMLSPANMERLVAKLSRMRGAALKLGQMMSFQDSKMLPAPIQEVLQRVQDSADYMPASQRDKVLASNLGPNWRDLFSSFDEIPIAAASIGQVHGAVLKSTGQRVAVKVQYPGVAGSIDSDLNNLSILLTASRLLPKGLYLDKTIANARTELAWECDYVREAECGRRFRDLLKNSQDVFLVPEIFAEASGKQVLTMERMDGVGVTKVQNFTQEQKDWVGTQILRLCLREITEFKFMQTDPNWTNFLYNAETNKLELLDFGASRAYPEDFIRTYTHLLYAASTTNKPLIHNLSLKLGYLTGAESPAMLTAHTTSILTLAEPFRATSPEVYDFRDQTITDRVKGQIPLMLRERLTSPPEETYSLHRKLSGAFLLCARLGSRVRCRDLFQEAMEKAGVVDRNGIEQ
ncbi:MAG: hypothetical protein M1819_007190 [Sarea resinae]|nr:MAG: hypothetical protein M1819_007190 [Sarea resinae]